MSRDGHVQKIWSILPWLKTGLQAVETNLIRPGLTSSSCRLEWKSHCVGHGIFRLPYIDFLPGPSAPLDDIACDGWR